MYDAAGPRDAPAIVFIHGTRLTRAVWGPQMAGLASEFRTIAVDLPGHGALADEPFTLDGAAASVARVIDEEAGGRAVVVGLSLGGYVAMELAARSPGHVRGLVLAGATADPTGLRRAPYLGLAWAMATFEGPRLEALNRWFFRTRFAADIAEPIVAGGFWTRSGATALRSIAGQSFLPRLAAYPGPTLLLNGAYDIPFRPSIRAFAGAAQHPTRVRLARASHLSNLDRPAAFNEAVRRFARTVDAATPRAAAASAAGSGGGRGYTSPTLPNPPD
jgi:pimeloyl-ACP methyl ester carboxylesterase